MASPAVLPAHQPGLAAVRTAAARCEAPHSPPGEPATDIAALPDDLLRSIFAHVSLLDRAVTLRCVCTRWRAALEGPPAETPPGAVRVRGAPPPDSAFARIALAAEPRLAGRVDVALLARLLWLSDVGAPPLAAKAFTDTPDVLAGGRAPIPPPGWDAPRPHLRALDLRGCAWRPSSTFRAPPLRRVLGLAPGLTLLRADGMALAGVGGGGGGDSGAGGGEGWDAPPPAARHVALDAREAALLRSAAAAHPALVTAVVDVAFALPPTAGVVGVVGGGGGGGPPPPPGAAADLADAVAAAGGPGPLALGRLAVSSRPSAWWYPERPAWAAAAAAVGASAGGPGGPETLELVRLSGEEAEALCVAALGGGGGGAGAGHPPSSSPPCRVRALVITGCADGAAAWSPALAAAVGACPSLESVSVRCAAWDEADVAGLAAAVRAAARAGRVLAATVNGVAVPAAAPRPTVMAPITPDRPAGRVVRVGV